MNKSELVKAVAEKAHLSNNGAKNAVEAVLSTIIENANEGVTLPGFGKFETKKMSARKARNPQTGESITVEARNKVSFKAYETFRQAVNQ